MKLIFIFNILAGILSLQACSQNNAKSSIDQNSNTQKPIGGSCEDCKALYESPIALDKLSWIDTLPDFNEPGPQLMISGTIYKADGVTPAPDVVLYIYHTDQKGEYTNKYSEKGWAARQGYIRGWMKTNEKGQYRFYTLRPASYPNSTAIQHIHSTIKEPGKNEYWIDEFVFDDDPFLIPEVKKSHQQRGGDGTIRLTHEKGLFLGERNIYLGKNIPGYPVAQPTKKEKKSTVSIYPETDFTLSTLIPHWESIVQ